MWAAFSLCAGGRSGVVTVLRREMLAELTEREVAREDECEAMALVPASRGRRQSQKSGSGDEGDG